MKHTLYIYTAGISIMMMLLAAACTNDTDIDTDAHSLPVRVIAQPGYAAHTRAAVKTTFAPGDAITLYLLPSDRGNVYTLDADGTTWLPAGGDPMLLPATGNANINAYYDATNPADLYANDLTRVSIFGDDLNATAYTQDGTIARTATEARVTLNFTHINALITLGALTDAQGNTIDPDDVSTIDLSVITFTLAGSRYLIRMETPPGSVTPEVIAPHSTINTIAITLKSGFAYTATPATPAARINPNTEYKLNIHLTGEAATFTVDETNDLGWSVQPEKEVYGNDYNYTIRTVEDLIEFRKAVFNTPNGNVTAIQMADIAFGENDAPWIPIGYDEAGSSPRLFTGVYNGNGYTITGPRITGSYEYAGLFGRVREAVLTGIHLRGVDIDNTRESSTCTGALAGSVQATLAGRGCISLCSAEGTVKGKGSHTGGLVGDATNIHITRCRTNCVVSVETTALAGYTGGLVGYAQGSALVACQAGGEVTASGNNNVLAGGLVGYTNNMTTIASCRATGHVTATGSSDVCAGGLVGLNGKNIFNSYATGHAQATGTGSNIYAGSLAGVNNSLISACHANGQPDTPIGQQNGTGTPATNPDTRKGTVCAIMVVSDIYTTVWQPGQTYSKDIVKKTFNASYVWTDEYEPLINFDFNGQ